MESTTACTFWTAGRANAVGNPRFACAAGKAHRAHFFSYLPARIICGYRGALLSSLCARMNRGALSLLPRRQPSSST